MPQNYHQSHWFWHKDGPLQNRKAPPQAKEGKNTLNIPKIVILVYFWTYIFALFFGGLPSIPHPHTSAKVSRYKWEAYRDTNWWCIYYFLPRGGHTFAKVSRWKWEVYRDTFQKYRGQGSIWLSWILRVAVFSYPVGAPSLSHVIV